MPELAITVDHAASIPFSAAPTIGFDVTVSNANPSETIHAIVLRCQIQIDATKRHYSGAEQQALQDLFDVPGRWRQTLRPMLWTHASIAVPSFTGSVTVNLPVACTFDFNVAATKFFAGLEEGEVPLLFLFSGTIFYADRAGALNVAPISWQAEAGYRMPVSVWRAMMNHYYSNTAWLCLRQDVFERLNRFKTRRGIPTWEQAVEALLAVEDAGATQAQKDQTAAALLAALRTEGSRRS